MNGPHEPMQDLIAALTERAKELNCLYGVEEILNSPDIDVGEACQRIIGIIPPGWQFPDICVARIELRGIRCESPDFRETDWMQEAAIRTQAGPIGRIAVYYTEEMPEEDHGPFLKEEERLIRTIADRIGHFIQHLEMREHFRAIESAREDLGGSRSGDFRMVIELLRRTDEDLYRKIAQKLLHHLCWSGIAEAEQTLRRISGRQLEADVFLDSNVPHQAAVPGPAVEFAEETFRIAETNLTSETILWLVQKWLQEDRLSFLVSAVERNLPLDEVADSIRRYYHLAAQEGTLSKPASAHIRVALIRRFLSEQLGYIRNAKEVLSIGDFYRLIPRVIAPSESHGRLGGKSAGLILASRIVERERERVPALGEIRTPKTWHVTSDMHVHFMHYNNLDEVAEQKYKDIGQVRLEYPHIVQSCKNSRFPSSLVHGLSTALDDFGDSPIIVRSSSVLEDRIGAAFSGKYKSLFLGNQGTKQERLAALLDAIAEVYASMFAPDPIQYRAERGLLDFSEEMGIIIQEVVGRRVGKYYFPLFAGVALSRNEFRWSPRIKRDDGIVRLVPGLGTRAVDRVGDDFPVMFAPRQPNLRVNVTPEEVLRYAPRWLDVIDLESNTFVTLSAADLLRDHWDDIPGIRRLVSIYEDERLRTPSAVESDLDPADAVITFKGQLEDRAFLDQMQALLDVLEKKTNGPVDVEFAHDGEHLHLLQCRSQIDTPESVAAPIPKDVHPDRLVFTAKRYVSNGIVPNVSHIVYVDPERYAALPDRDQLTKVARAVGELNKLLPKRRFILMGPGRWGSRGDIKLGVSVSYADINNTALLVEIARQKGNYTPDLSFGTHFFQDLVEARIRYLPLYPDDDGTVFNERFLRGSRNVLSDITPRFRDLEDVVRVIDVGKVTDGLALKVLMNSDLDEAVGMIGEPGDDADAAFPVPHVAEGRREDHSVWRLRMAERIAETLDAEKYGVVAFYVFGSTKNFTAGPGSDIDVLVHFRGTPEQRERLMDWLDGWSRCLEEVNYLRTGYRGGGLLDAHLVTDSDIEKKTSYAVKIGAVTDAARPLPIGARA